MANSGLIKIHDNLLINLGTVSYVEFTRKGGADIHFAGKAKPLHLKRNEIGSLHRYVQEKNLRRIDEAA